MNQDRNPWDIPEWHALRREALLVRHLIGSGATALGRANYADKMGEYYTAFFGLSVGLERLAKLILVADYAMKNDGKMPKEIIIIKYGHNIIKLVKKVEKISQKVGINPRYNRPTDKISNKILECLDAFSDARRGRYANFASLDNPNLTCEEPIERWWNQVAEEVLQEYYYGKAPQKRLEEKCNIMHSAVSDVAFVCYTNESRINMNNIYDACVRTGQNEIVQKYGRYHALTIVRWLSCIMSDISDIACHTYNIECFFGFREYFQTYKVDEYFLKNRKIWPLK